MTTPLIGTYLSKPRRDAVTLTLTLHTARAFALSVIDPEGVSEDVREGIRKIAEAMFLLSERSPVDPVAFTFDGVEWDDLADSMTAGTVALLMLDYFDRAKLEKQRLGVDYGVE